MPSESRRSSADEKVRHLTGVHPAVLGGARRKNDDLFSAVHWLASESSTPWNFFFSYRKPADHFSGMETDFITRVIKTLARTAVYSKRHAGWRVARALFFVTFLDTEKTVESNQFRTPLLLHCKI